MKFVKIVGLLSLLTFSSLADEVQEHQEHHVEQPHDKDAHQHEGDHQHEHEEDDHDGEDEHDDEEDDIGHYGEGEEEEEEEMTPQQIQAHHQNYAQEIIESYDKDGDGKANYEEMVEGLKGEFAEAVQVGQLEKDHHLTMVEELYKDYLLEPEDPQDSRHRLFDKDHILYVLRGQDRHGQSADLTKYGRYRDEDFVVQRDGEIEDDDSQQIEEMHEGEEDEAVEQTL